MRLFRSTGGVELSFGYIYSNDKTLRMQISQEYLDPPWIHIWLLFAYNNNIKSQAFSLPREQYERHRGSFALNSD